MTSQMKSAALMLLAISAMTAMPAYAAESAGVIWAANPTGVQSMPDARALALLPASGYVPLQTSGGKCLLVARRGTQIVAVELQPLAIGAKVIGWKPQPIDMNRLTSKWGYQVPDANPVTQNIAESNVKAKAWSNTNVDTHSQALGSGETESAETVTANGKTYRKYSHFKPASADAPVAASDEYFCQ